MNLREAAMLALYALELEDMACRHEKEQTPEQIAKAITALRNALAEPERRISYVCPQCHWTLDTQRTESEPVAWADLREAADEIVKSKSVWKRFIDGTPLANDIAGWMADFAQDSHPPQRKPLTDEEIAAMCESVPDYDISNYDLIQFARAIEARHGIGYIEHPRGFRVHPVTGDFGVGTPGKGDEK